MQKHGGVVREDKHFKNFKKRQEFFINIARGFNHRRLPSTSPVLTATHGAFSQNAILALLLCRKGAIVGHLCLPRLQERHRATHNGSPVGSAVVVHSDSSAAICGSDDSLRRRISRYYARAGR